MRTGALSSPCHFGTLSESQGFDFNVKPFALAEAGNATQPLHFEGLSEKLLVFGPLVRR